MALSIVLQGFVYYRFGGTSGYIGTYSNIGQGGSFEGFGLVFVFPEPFPILAVFAYAYWVHRTGRGRGWPTIALVLLAFLASRLLFGGLRGSRANIVWPLFWSIDIIHRWVRPFGRKLVLGGLVFLVLFIYSYSFYKFNGTSALRTSRSSTSSRAACSRRSSSTSLRYAVWCRCRSSTATSTMRDPIPRLLGHRGEAG